MDAERDPNSKVKRKEGIPNGVLVWATVVLTRVTKGTCQYEERGGRCEVADKAERM